MPGPENLFGGGRSEADALTQKDIDNLLQSSASGAGVQRRPAVQVIPYNFLRPPRISKDRRIQLESIYSRFALSVQSRLSSRLRTPMDVSCTVEQATFSEYVLSIANPCAAFTFSLGPSIGGQGAIDLSTELAFFIIDRVFGGPGEATRLERGLTQLERSVTRGFVEKLLVLFRESWQEHLPFTPELTGFESTPDMLQIASHEDNVLVANLEVRSGQFNSLVAMCLPLISLESFLGERARGISTTSKGPVVTAAVRDQVEAAVRGAHVDLSVRFPPLRLSAREVAGLKVGQIIQTSQPIDGPIELLVNGKRRFAGMLGQYRRMLGLRLTQTISSAAQAASRPSRGRIQ
jgi:flagellar motor switch protein FliM